MQKKKRIRLTIALACLLMLRVFALAQLPTPTYGWNLGNTLEPPSGEGTWGPVATQNLINSVADSGFNTIRLPVAWDSHANQSTYVIDPAWLARVKQVVDWCYAKNLTVIVNCHWDGGWLENNITDTVNPTINAKMQSYWTQIATAFAGYDNRLLFAGANEPNCDTAAKWATLRSYYNTFISAVRATGGHNATRWLVVQGPSTNIDLTYDLVNTLPTDSASGRLMVEVHYYPWRWTLMTEDAWWGKMFYFWGQGYHSPTMLDRNSTAEEETFTDEQFQKMATKFVSKGVPVIIGEWGAMKRTGYPDLTGTELNRHLASRTYFSKYVTDKANSLGLKPIWWDAGGTGSNTMWLFDRYSASAPVWDLDNVRALTGGAALAPPGGTGIIEGQSASRDDFDGDGKSDLLWTNTQTGERSMWFLNGSTQSGGASLGVVPVAWVASTVADFDGDGKADIFWTNTLTGDRAIWLMNGSTMRTNTFMGTVPVDWVISGAGDFNGDGKADLVWTNTTTGDRAMWLMNGSTVIGGGYLGTVPVAWKISGVGDFDGDGKSDLVWSNTITGERSMWFMNGSTTIGGATLTTVPIAWSISGVGDFNADGKADIVLSNTTTGDRVIWLMNGSTITTNAFMGTVPIEWTVSSVGDFDGDRKADLVWTNTATGDRAMWLINGSTVTGGGFLGTVPVIWKINN